jgi:hypothetical protein
MAIIENITASSMDAIKQLIKAFSHGLRLDYSLRYMLLIHSFLVTRIVDLRSISLNLIQQGWSVGMS